ncbi:MAG: hypothetical protein QF535_01580, partial [Anaerolineales bacterium]|nr:hypothetical protein [Anaerolineales bacterium]
NWQMYINGTKTSTSETQTTTATFAEKLFIGDYRPEDAVSSNFFNGYMDEIRISNVARYSDSFIPSTVPFTNDANTKLLIHSNTTMGSTTFTDSGASTHTITANGNVKHIAPKIGTGMAYFDGTGDYIAAPQSNDWKFGTDNFTIETWVYNATAQAQSESLMTFSTSGDGGGTQIEWNSNGTMTIWDTDLFSSNQGGTTNSATPVGSWWHFAYVRNGTTFTVYVNGVAQTSTATSSNAVDPPTGPQIGFHRNTGNRYLQDTYLDSFRISRTARYTSNFTPHTTAHKDDKDTVLLLHMDGGGGIDPTTNLPTLAGQGTYFWDASTNAIFYDADGLPTNKSLMDFDGSGDKLTVAASNDWAFGTNPFTMEGWAYLDTMDGGSVTESAPLLTSGTLATATGQFRVGAWEMGGVDAIGAAIYSTAGGGSWPVHPYPNKFESPIPGQWIHWAFTRSGNTWTTWMDGK